MQRLRSAKFYVEREPTINLKRNLREDFKKKRVNLVTSYILGLKPTLPPPN